MQVLILRFMFILQNCYQRGDKVTLHHYAEELSYRAISERLNILFSTIGFWVAKWKNTGFVNWKTFLERGAPENISPKAAKMIRRVNEHHMTTRKEIKNDLKVVKTSVTKRAISNEQHRNDLTSRSPRKTPLLSKSTEMLD